MYRFQYQKSSRHISRTLLSILICFLIILAFMQGISSLSEDTTKRQRTALEQAINRSVACCYSMEGSYPEDLEYLKEHYGLTYNEDLFFVDYRIVGANLMPDITIIEKEE